MSRLGLGFKQFLHGWIVYGGGAGGGLSSVTTNSTLTGNCTGGSPLSVANQPLIWFGNGETFANWAPVANATGGLVSVCPMP